MNIKRSFALFGALAIGAAAAHGAIVASDDFSYPDGLLTGQNGGTGWSAAWDNNPLCRWLIQMQR